MESKYEIEAYLLADTRGPARQKAWYGWVLEYVNQKEELVTREGFGELEETQNGINIKALGILLSHLKHPCRVHLHTNCRHLESVISHRWIQDWADNGWKNSSDKEIKNRALWEKTWEYMKDHEITAAYERQHSYSDWILSEIRKEKSDGNKKDAEKTQETRQEHTPAQRR